MDNVLNMLTGELPPTNAIVRLKLVLVIKVTYPGMTSMTI